MFLGVRKGYWLLLLLALLLVGAVVGARYSPLFAVRRMVIRGPHADRLDAVVRKQLNLEDNLFALDKQRLMQSAMRESCLGNVSFRFGLSGTFEAEVNQYAPVALIGQTELNGIDSRGRVIPYDTAWQQVDLPVLTGLKTRHLFEVPADFRVAEVIAGLDSARQNYPDLYHQIAEIDFSDPMYLTMYLTSGSGRILAVGNGFPDQMRKLYALFTQETWTGDAVYNLAFDNVVIKESNEEKNGTDADSNRT